MWPTMVAIMLGFAKRPENAGPSIPECSLEIKVNVTTSISALCVPREGGKVEYTARLCSADGKLEYTSAKAIDMRGGLSSGDCHWNWTTHPDRELLAGGCGKGPTNLFLARSMPIHCSGDFPARYFYLDKTSEDLKKMFSRGQMEYRRSIAYAKCRGTLHGQLHPQTCHRAATDDPQYRGQDKKLFKSCGAQYGTFAQSGSCYWRAQTLVEKQGWDKRCMIGARCIHGEAGRGNCPGDMACVMTEGTHSICLFFSGTNGYKPWTGNVFEPQVTLSYTSLLPEGYAC